jgi:hypothetical protein
MLAAMLPGGTAAQQSEAPAPPSSRIEASQIELPDAAPRTGRAYLDETGRPAPLAITRESLAGTVADPISHADSAAPATQISNPRESGSGIVQLSKADLDATLSQLSPAERRVLLQAIEGTDICDNPPRVAAIIALCQTRIETRAQEFSTLPEIALSAEDRLLRGDLESTTLPSIAQVIERLARGGASSGDVSNQAIAAMALGTTPVTTDKPRDEDSARMPKLGEEAQSLINALITQLGGNSP